jgi:hypothetical protein
VSTPTPPARLEHRTEPAARRTQASADRRVSAERPDRSDEISDEISDDDRDLGWGDRAPEGSRDEWYRRERPPHHGG